MKVAGNEREIILLTPILFPGNSEISENDSNRRTSRRRSNKAKESTTRECIEIDVDGDVEKENMDVNVSKNKRTTRQSNRVAQKTPKKEVRTPRKTPQKGEYLSGAFSVIKKTNLQARNEGLHLINISSRALSNFSYLLFLINFITLMLLR